MITAPILHKSIHKTLDWLYELEEFCDWEDSDQRKALAVLRATLHELRDLLPLENMAHLSAQLPLLIRGLFFEGWDPQLSPSRERKKEDFLNKISNQIREEDIEDVVKNVFKVLMVKIDPGEITKLKKVLPKEIKSFFD